MNQITLELGRIRVAKGFGVHCSRGYLGHKEVATHFAVLVIHSGS